MSAETEDSRATKQSVPMDWVQERKAEHSNVAQNLRLQKFMNQLLTDAI